jgi:hypothetical protein
LHDFPLSLANGGVGKQKAVNCELKLKATAPRASVLFLPNIDGPVGVAGGEVFAVGAERHLPHARMSAQGFKVLAGGRVPKAHCKDNFNEFVPETFDLIVSLFTFDNVPSAAKVRIFSDLRNLLRPAGTMVSVVSSPEIYTHEWASFTTQDFPENAAARSGDVVRIIVTDHQDRRPVEDILWTDESYWAVYRKASLQAVQVFKPLAKGDEPYSWVNETKIPPWVIYLLRRAT